jgi:hypothetical protein
MRFDVGPNVHLLWKGDKEIGVFIWHGQAMGYVERHFGVGMGEDNWEMTGESGTKGEWHSKDGEFEIIPVPFMPIVRDDITQSRITPNNMPATRNAERSIALNNMRYCLRMAAVDESWRDEQKSDKWLEKASFWAQIAETLK